jgi:hypothetical protein
VVPKSAGFSIPDAKPWALPGYKRCPPTMVETRWSSLGRSFGDTPTRKGLDPNRRLYQAGVGTVQPRHKQTPYMKSCVVVCVNKESVSVQKREMLSLFCSRCRPSHEFLPSVIPSVCERLRWLMQFPRLRQQPPIG